MLYPMDSAIHLLNNWSHLFINNTSYDVDVIMMLLCQSQIFWSSTGKYIGAAIVYYPF